MEIKGKITFLVDKNKTTIQLHDDGASITFCEIELTNDQLASALSRMGYTECKSVNVFGLDKLGKKHENTHQKSNHH